MNALIDAAISRRRTTLSIMLLLVLAGLFARSQIAIEAEPRIAVPFFVVRVAHEGISPEDAERLLVMPLERELRAVEGVKEIKAYASQGLATITIEFDAESDLSEAGIDVREAVDDWLRRVGLQPDHMSRYPHEFSGGQRQRIGVARALIMEPEFVVCDEPISALDVSVQAQVVNLLDELKHSLGLTLLFIAHDLSMVRYVSDRMAVMYLGMLVEVGPANRVFFNPSHPYTQMLVGSNPEPDPESERRRQRTPAIGEIPSPVNVPPGCRFAGRCPQVMDVCRNTTPQLIPLAGDDEVAVACHLYRHTPAT